MTNLDAERQPADATSRHVAPTGDAGGWAVIADRELRDLWVAGRGLPLLLAFAVLIAITFYLAATNRALNFLEGREAVNLTLQMAVAVGDLLVLLVAADAISGERERETLETLLLASVSRRSVIVGKAIAALSLWVATIAVTIPYLWFLARGVGLAGVSVLGGLVVGGLLAVFLTGYGLIISMFSATNRISLAVSLFGLLAIYAPSQLPAGAKRGWVADLLLRIDPMTSGLHYLESVIVDGHPIARDADWLAAPVIAAAFATGIGLAVAGRLALHPGDGR
jgi:ABC-2 type transport system permease protein